MNRLPSLVSPFIATKTVPGRARRESYSTPATAGFPLCERTSAPCRSCWNVMGVIITTRNYAGTDTACNRASRKWLSLFVAPTVLRLWVFDIDLLGRWKREFPRANDLDSKASREFHHVLIVGVYARRPISLCYRDNLTIESEFCPRTGGTCSLAFFKTIFHVNCREFNSRHLIKGFDEDVFHA